MRIGIIGAGTMGRVHAEALTKIAGATVAAFGAPDIPPATVALAERLGADLLPSAQELLARADIDAVVVAAPTDVHCEVVLAAAAAGKHVLCEKPLARTIQQGEAMIEAAGRAGIKLAAAQVVRYFADYAAAHDMIVAGELGTPGVARATRGAGFPQVADNWYGDLERSGGVVLDMMVHDFDWLRWTFGPAEQLYARGLTYAGRPGKDAVMAVVRFHSGALAYVEGSWAYPSVFRTTLEVSGSAGLIRTSSRDIAPLSFELFPAAADRVPMPTGALSESPYVAQMRDFIGWLAGGPAPRCGPEEALEALRLSLAALESTRTGRPVRFGNLS